MMDQVYLPTVFVLLAAPSFLPGTKIEITVPVTSRSSDYVRVKVKVIIYEGSVLATRGTKLAEYTTPEYNHPPGTTGLYIVEHTTVKGTIDRRDVGVVVYYWDGSKWVEGPTAEWDDVYFVAPLVAAFEIGYPTVEAAGG